MPTAQPLPEYYRHALEVIEDRCRPPDNRPIWQWAEDNIKLDPSSSYGGMWKSSITPWVRQPMEDAQNNEVEVITVKCSAQSAKTEFLKVVLSWVICNDPAPALWVTSTQDQVKDFKEDRLIPTLQLSECTARILSDSNTAGRNIKFPRMNLYLSGGNSKAAIESRPVRWLFKDEVRRYPKGHSAMMDVRTDAWWNSRIFNISTAGDEGDDIDTAFLEGDQNVWNVKCMNADCGEWNELLWKNVDYDSQLAREIPVKWEELYKSIAYVCPSCGHRHKDTGRVRNHFIKENVGGKNIPRNPDAPKSHKSYHWNQLLPLWIKWKTLVRKYVIAVSKARFGDLEDLKDFFQQNMGQSWEDRLGAVDTSKLLESRLRPYNLGQPWPEAAYRFISADKQQKGGTHYWYVIREFSLSGESRLVAFGKAHSTEELNEQAETYKVPANCRIIDCSYDWTNVLLFCKENGWRPFKGDKAPHFTVTPPARKGRKKPKPIRQSWRKAKEPVNYGKKGRKGFIDVTYWSNSAIKDVMAEVMAGEIMDFTIPEDISETYTDQLTAEVRKERIDATGKKTAFWKKIREHDHLRDCELQILVATIQGNIFQLQIAK